MAAPNFAQAFKTLVSIASNNFNVLTLEFDASAPLDDITYTTAGGATFAIKIAGYVSGRGTMEFVYDAANQPTISPFNIVPGVSAAIIAYPEGTKPFTFSVIFGRLRWRGGPQANAGGASVRCTSEFETTGSITYPTS